MIMHALIVGEPGVGKSTLIARVIERLNRPVFGFETRKEPSLERERAGVPVYIYPLDGKTVRGEGVLVGYTREKHLTSDTNAFEAFSEHLMRTVPDGGVIKLDELGVMESGAEKFCGAVLKLLDGDVPVIAAVKTKNSAFLDAVKSHRNCRVFEITHENRDALCDEVLAFLQKNG